MDPMLALFGRSALSLFEDATFLVTHGQLERFPQWMRSGLLENVESLCRDYRGTHEIAHGGQGGLPSTTPESFIGAGGQTPVRGANAHALLRLGLTVYFAALNDAIPEGKAFLADLDKSLGLPPCSTMSAFVNAKGSGLPYHHDSHDQLLIQLQGEKKITRAFKPAEPHPRISTSPHGPTPQHFETVYRNGFVGDIEEIEELGSEVHTLKPGSCLFLPGGTWHRTADQEGTCLSLVVAVRAPSLLDLVENALTYFAAQSGAWRSPAYGLFTTHCPEGEESEDPKREDTIDEVSNSAARAAFSPLLQQLSRQLSSIDSEVARKCWLVRGLKNGAAADYPKAAGFTHYIRLPGTAHRFESGSQGTLRLICRCAHSITDGILEFHAAARPIVEAALATHKSFSASSLARPFEDFEEAEVLEFLDQLASVGLLRPVAAPPFPSGISSRPS